MNYEACSDEFWLKVLAGFAVSVKENTQLFSIHKRLAEGSARTNISLSIRNL